MKRLALLLGSLLVVSAAASAKEVVPAPVVVQETPVQIVEKEVIVYREKAPEWRPSGFFDVQERYYGKTENHKENVKNGGWNDHNQYGRLQIEAGVQMTENQSLDIRTRSFQNWNGLEQKKDDAVRVRYHYDHGHLGDSKVDMNSLVRYEKEGKTQTAEYRLNFDFAEYLFNNDFVKTTTATVGPRYIYSWNGQGEGHVNTLGLYADFINELPLGFSTEIELDGVHYNWNQTAVDNEGHKKDFTLSVAAKLMHNYNLYAADNYSIDWAFEGGYDTFNYSDRKINDGEHAKYSVYAEPSLTLTYNATKFVDVYGTIGAEYRNWDIEANSEASHWRWQPYATLGVKTTF